MDSIIKYRDVDNSAELVSVIMPAFNAEKYIADAIASVIQQTHRNWELLVIDDGSTDQTAKIIQQIAMEDERIKYFFRENSGQGAARNVGIRNARGNFIAFLDADDLWMPEKLHAQLTLMILHRVDLLFSDAFVFEEKPSQEKKIKIETGFYKGEKAIRKFIGFNPVPMLTALVKKSAIEGAGGFSSRRDISEDYDLWIRMLIGGCIFFGLDRPLAYYRSHRNSSSSGEGKLLLLTINTLQQIKSTFPRYSTGIDRSLYDLISSHLTKVNVRRWKMAQHLLEIRNALPGKKVSVSFWKKVYLVFGKDAFRILFNLLTSPSPRSGEGKGEGRGEVKTSIV